MKKNGFTLIELIVVITIIAVISTIAIVSFGGSSKKSRDARRMADLEKIRIALEIYKQENSAYPASIDNLVTAYLQTKPIDPKGGAYNYYQLTSFTYRLNANMEDLGSTTVTCASACCRATCNYEIVNP